MKIFITGGTGFVGRHLIDRLRDASHEMVCLVRRRTQAGWLEEAGATLVRGDLADGEGLASAMAGCEAVVHLAAAYNFWSRDPAEYVRVNVEGTRNLMLAAKECGVGKIIHVSTAAVWGKAPWPITEETPFGKRCASAYARSKRVGEEAARELAHTHGLPLVILYPSAIVGSDDPHASGRYIRRIVERKLPARVLAHCPFSFVHVRDVAEAILRALEKEGNVGERYLVSGGNRTFGEINQAVVEACGVCLPRLALPDWMTILGAGFLTSLSRLTRRPPPLDLAWDQILLMHQGFQVDGSKTERELGVRYTPVEEGVREAVASYQS